MSSRIDVSVEHKRAAPEPKGKRHPNTCPVCASHYRDDERLRERQRQRRRLPHRLAAVAPRGRDADEAGTELAPAAVALVLVAERDGGERAAVGAACAEDAHESAFSYTSKRRITRMPTRS